MRAKILIGTPTYDEQVFVSYHVTMLKLHEAVRRYPDVSLVTAPLDTSLLIEARNAFASKVLNDPSYTHLLFVDADMGFQPELVLKMLQFAQPFVGCFYPRRSTDWDRLQQLVREGADAALLRALSQGFIGTPWRNGSGQSLRRGDFIRAESVGAGVLLLERAVLERLRDANRELWMETAPRDMEPRFGLKGGYFQIFHPLLREDGLVLGEDLSFCHRWVHGLGGEIWACASETVTHSGRERFAGAFAETLRANETRRASGPATFEA